MLKLPAIFFVFLLLGTLNTASEVVYQQKSRLKDAWGSGKFLSSRDKGGRAHEGLDIAVAFKEKIYAPFEGSIVREAFPYKDDLSYKGIVLQGSGAWTGYEVKIFYVEGIVEGKVTAGQEIGTAQDLNIRYPGITNHIHFEVKLFSVQIDPFEIWQYSF